MTWLLPELKFRAYVITTSTLYAAEEYSHMQVIHGECRCNTSEAARLDLNSRHSVHFVFVNDAYRKRRSSGRPRTDYDDIV